MDPRGHIYVLKSANDLLSLVLYCHAIMMELPYVRIYGF